MKLFLTLLLGVCSVAYGQTVRANAKVVLPDSTRDIASRLNDTVSVKDYGAKADGVTDDTGAMNAALTAASGKVIVAPAGNYAINGTVTVPASTVLQLGPGNYTLGNSGKFSLPASKSKLVCPGGPDNTIISVPSSYTVTTGAIEVTGPEPSAWIEGCAVFFVQPDVSTLAGLTHYAAAAVYAPAPAARARFLHMKIVRAWDGFRTAGGGADTWDDIEMSSFHYGIDIDGSLDTTRINNLHWWPFGLTNNQITAASDPANIGIRSGRSDDLKISNSLFLGGTALVLYTSGLGQTFGTITNSSFDTYGGVNMSSGILDISSSYFSDQTGYKSVVVTGPSLLHISATNFNGGGPFMEVNGGAYAEVSDVGFQIGALTSTPPIRVMNLAHLVIDGCTTQQGGLDMTFMQSEGGFLNVHHCYFDANSSTVSFTNPLIRFTTNLSRGIISDNIFRDTTPGHGNAIKADFDSWMRWHDNLLLGWGLSIPGGATQILTHDN